MVGEDGSSNPNEENFQWHKSLQLAAGDDKLKEGEEEEKIEPRGGMRFNSQNEPYELHNDGTWIQHKTM